MGEHILLIEDDEALSRMMRIQLEHAGYQVTPCLTGTSGLQAARNVNPDLVLLDILLPDMDGWEVCQQLKDITDAPIIFSTALGSEKDVIHGLELGADDYIIKPFSYKELLARIRAALHRARRGAGSCGAVYRGPRLTVDLNRGIVKLDGQVVSLTPLEYKLLAVLVEEAGHIVPHNTLLRRVWGPRYENQWEYLKLYIGYLRQKLEADPDHPQLILSHEMGYQLAAPSDSTPESR